MIDYLVLLAWTAPWLVVLSRSFFPHTSTSSSSPSLCLITHIYFVIAVSVERAHARNFTRSNFVHFLQKPTKR
ncbi:MAG: hypothetical protein JOS17DRAFT_761449 [Linnemannia elongata]|nr:MAG: hypothetical protein JOS17DRAFT_761449 [Linnemannia elongata]